MEYLRDHPEKIYKYRKELTQDDVTDIMQKVKFDQSLQDIRKAEVQRGMKKIDGIRQNVETGLKWYQTGKNAYNTIAEVHNAILDMSGNTDRKRMLKFGEKNDSSLKELEKLLRTPDGVEQIYRNKDKYSTDDLNKAFKRKQIENLLKAQVEANNSQQKPQATTDASNKKTKKNSASDDNTNTNTNDDDDGSDGNSGKAHGIKSQKMDKRSIYDKTFDEIIDEAADEYVGNLRKREDRSKTSGQVVNKFLKQLIEQERYDDAERYFPEEMQEFYKLIYR